MKTSYILQIHTGSFLNAHTSLEKVKEKMGELIRTKNIQAVIFGWHLDLQLNAQLLDYFHQANIPCYFWLPVLSEIDQIMPSISLTNYTGQKSQCVQVIEDESFSFLCPSHQDSYQNVVKVYEKYLAKLDFDGVFLDKIRFPSFANGYEEGFGCFCEECQEAYQNAGIDVEALKLLFSKHDDALLKGHYDAYGHYLFDHATVNSFYQVRAHLITQLIGQLSDFFHSKNLKVGLDIYAPFFAYHCGQDIQALSKKADFLKPMFYRFTTAPAGMQYEYDAYKKYFPNSSEFKLDPISLSSLAKQVAYLKQSSCEVYPGIEVNPIENICHTDLERFRENQAFFFQDFDCLVCCWNCLLMDEDIQNHL